MIFTILSHERVTRMEGEVRCARSVALLATSEVVDAVGAVPYTQDRLLDYMLEGSGRSLCVVGGQKLERPPVLFLEHSLLRRALPAISTIDPMYVVVFGAHTTEDVKEIEEMLADRVADVRVMCDHGDGRHEAEVLRTIRDTADEVYGVEED